MKGNRSLPVVLALAGATALVLVVIRALMPPPPPEATARAGAEVFWGRGRCAGCHPLGGEGGGVRCPDLGREGGAGGPSFAERAARRVPGMGAGEYVVRSLYRPDEHTVPGYPGRLMPPVHEPPVALPAEDVRAVALFLLGAEPDSPLGREVRATQARLAPRRPGFAAGRPTGDVGRGRELFARMKCLACHEEARLAPSLRGIGAIQGPGYLEESIVDPDAVVVRGPHGEYVAADGRTSRMPSYRDLLAAGDVADLVAFLADWR